QISSTASSTMNRGGLGASLLSVRSSIQSSIRSVGIFLVSVFTHLPLPLMSPFLSLSSPTTHTDHRCCLGCVSLRDAIPLICVAQFILLAMASVIVLDLYLSDGNLFYTRTLEGKGAKVARSFVGIVSVSFFMHFLTVLAWKYGRSRLYLVHAIWKLFLVGILSFLLVQVIYGMHVSPPTILFASGCVLCTFFAIVIVLELWWAFVMVDAAFFEGFYYRRPSSRGENDDESTNYRLDSKHGVVPVVTVDCVSE
ncbi:hypothetical protein PFISCL1PPCAC_27423, partial [Pristionchus fissidentatus]